MPSISDLISEWKFGYNHSGYHQITLNHSPFAGQTCQAHRHLNFNYSSENLQSLINLKLNHSLNLKQVSSPAVEFRDPRYFSY